MSELRQSLALRRLSKRYGVTAAVDDKTNIAADDYVEYTSHAPTARLYIGRTTLPPPKSGYRYPDWSRYAMMGVPDCVDPMWSSSARVIGATMVDLLTDGAALEKAKPSSASGRAAESAARNGSRRSCRRIFPHPSITAGRNTSHRARRGMDDPGRAQGGLRRCRS